MDWQAIRVDETLELASTPTRLDMDNAKAVAKGAAKELSDWQARLAAEKNHALLVVFQALDSGGKDGAIRRVFRDCSMQGVHVTRFGVPSEDERARDFLWRHHKAVPAKGEIGVWNRSHYEAVVTERVLDIVDDATITQRYGHIRDFETMLNEEGTRVVKFFLHISNDEQRRRLQRRLDDPRKRWKFDRSDVSQRARWDDITAAYQAALRATSTEAAPWLVVPADDKRERDAIVATELNRVLADMEPDYPDVKGLPERID